MYRERLIMRMFENQILSVTSGTIFVHLSVRLFLVIVTMFRRLRRTIALSTVSVSFFFLIQRYHTSVPNTHTHTLL